MASQGLRVLALAWKPLSKAEVSKVTEMKDLNPLESDLIFAGLVGIIDPPRKEVKGTVQKCKEAGIRVCMITGDHPSTAFAIACQLGLIEPHQEDLVVSGAELNAM